MSVQTHLVIDRRYAVEDLLPRRALLPRHEGARRSRLLRRRRRHAYRACHKRRRCECMLEDSHAARGGQLQTMSSLWSSAASRLTTSCCYAHVKARL